MNTALSLLNAVALVTLLVLHFEKDETSASVVATAAQFQGQLSRPVPPRVAHFDESGSSAMLATESNDSPIPVERTERWVF